MHLTALDWWIVVLSLGITFVPAIVLARRAGRNTSEFFAAGRQAPWWLIGISLVATTFSTDTPNLVTNIVREGGVAGNWVWWSFLLTGLATVFFYARLWRRSGVLTDLEFYEMRYSGVGARAVRGFRAVYLGLLFNWFIIATVNLALTKICGILFGWTNVETLAIAVVVPIVFAATAGLWGVMVTDTIQFLITMSSAIAAAYFALRAPHVGGLAGLFSQIRAVHPHWLSFFPNFNHWQTALAIFVIPLTVQWWSVWYPGAEPGGGSYVAQRMLAARSERDAMGGTLAFQAMHYALRPWPWIIVALASTIVYPTVHDIAVRFPHLQPALLGNDIAYPAMLVFMPAGFAGFMVAGIFAAYRSTIETHLNWGTSYLVHDLYRRFMAPGRDERHYVIVGRLVTVLIALGGVGVTFLLGTARQGFDLLLSIGAGTGLLYLLRWFWWRIDAASEIAAMVVSFLIAIAFFTAGKLGYAVDPTTSLLIGVGVTTLAWLGITLLFPPKDERTLVAFYQRIHPPGPGWKYIRERYGLPKSQDSPAAALAGWVLGLAAIYGALFATGAWLQAAWLPAWVWSAVSVVATLGLVAVMRRLWAGDEGTAETESQPSARES